MKAANNVASYFDKLSTLFMKLGLTCPRFTEFGYLYPASARLQNALCEYYGAVIRLCKHSTVSCGKPGTLEIRLYLRFSAYFLM